MLGSVVRVSFPVIIAELFSQHQNGRRLREGFFLPDKFPL